MSLGFSIWNFLIRNWFESSRKTKRREILSDSGQWGQNFYWGLGPKPIPRDSCSTSGQLSSNVAVLMLTGFVACNGLLLWSCSSNDRLPSTLGYFIDIVGYSADVAPAPLLDGLRRPQRPGPLLVGFRRPFEPGFCTSRGSLTTSARATARPTLTSVRLLHPSIRDPKTAAAYAHITNRGHTN